MYSILAWKILLQPFKAEGRSLCFLATLRVAGKHTSRTTGCDEVSKCFHVAFGSTSTALHLKYVIPDPLALILRHVCSQQSVWHGGLRAAGGKKKILALLLVSCTVRRDETVCKFKITIAVTRIIMVISFIVQIWWNMLEKDSSCRRVLCDVSVFSLTRNKPMLLLHLRDRWENSQTLF